MKTKTLTKTISVALAGVIGLFALTGAASAQAPTQSAAAPAAAATRIEAINGSIQAGGEILRINLSKPLAQMPATFAIQSPARIVLDFEGVSTPLSRSPIELNQGNLRSALLIPAGTKTRLLVNLKQTVPYKLSAQGNTLLILFETPSAPIASSAGSNPSTAVSAGAAQPKAGTNASQTVANFAESRNTDVQYLKDIDFRRGADNAGKVIVNLPNNQMGVDIKTQAGNLIVDFLKSGLPEGAKRRLDVTDFGTPVQMVNLTNVGDRVRMVIESKGQWEHSAYQTDTQFVIEVRQIKVDPGKLTQGVGYNGEKLSLNFQNIEIRSLLQVIADFTNFNVVTSETVAGSVTLRLKDVPWDQALDIIMQAKNLGLRKTGNVLWIAPKDELNLKEKQDLEAKAAIQNLEPVRTQAFQLNYTKAAEIAAQLNGVVVGGVGGGGANARILSPRGSAIAEPRTNQLFVTDIPTKIEQIQGLIARLDIAIRQVMIEARIVEADDNFAKTLGIKLGGTDLRAQRGGDGGYSVGGGNRVGFGSSYNNATITSGQGTSTIDPSSATFVNLPAPGSFVAGNPASFALSLFNAGANRFLNLELSALEAESKGKIVSSPRVVTGDQIKALIEQGTELPYRVSTSSGATSIAFRKATLKLEVTPQITPEGNVILDVDVNKDSVGQAVEGAGFAINTKHVKTQVLVENGGTVVIGGIFESAENEAVNKVPLLGDIPFLGALFRNKERKIAKSELLIFLTPKVITDRAATK